MKASMEPVGLAKVWKAQWRGWVRLAEAFKVAGNLAPLSIQAAMRVASAGERPFEPKGMAVGPGLPATRSHRLLVELWPGTITLPL